MKKRLTGNPRSLIKKSRVLHEVWDGLVKGAMEKVYTIGEMARMIGVHDQTIRMYERVGLITPNRNENGHRRFTQGDVPLITTIITLTQELGMNLAGVHLVLEMARRLKMNNDELLDFVLDQSDKLNVPGLRGNS